MLLATKTVQPLTSPHEIHVVNGDGLTITLEKNAVMHVHVRDDGKTGRKAHDTFIVPEGATLEVSLLQSGTENVERLVSIELTGQNASAHIRAVAFAQGKGHIFLETQIEHKAAHTQCAQTIHSLAAQSAKASYLGNIIVHEGAQKTSSAQIHHGLMLSDTAEIYTKPGLEIYADDVQCSHGASCGALDEAALFYMRSRGLSREVAEQLLLDAFIKSPFLDMEEGATKATLLEACEKLAGGAYGG